MLLFVVRDFPGDEDLEVLSVQIMDDVKEKIWKDLSKPSGLENRPVTDFFDFKFTALPHKKLEAKQFAESCKKLQERFVNENDPEFVFKKEYKKSLPIDSFQQYAMNIWVSYGSVTNCFTHHSPTFKQQIIVDNKDLDIPTQKEMVSAYRCEMIAKEEYVPFEETQVKWSEEVKLGKFVHKLGVTAKNAVEAVLEAYTQRTALYSLSVAEERRKELYVCILLCNEGGTNPISNSQNDTFPLILLTNENRTR